MKKVNYILLAFLLISAFIYAQDDFSTTPNIHQENYLNVTLDQNDDFVSESIMANWSVEELQINWTILGINQPQEWRVAISDLDNDYIINSSFLDDGGTNTFPLIFAPGNEKGIFNVHFYPTLVNGCADLLVEVTNATTGLVYDTLSYDILVNDCPPVSIVESFKDIGIHFSPNPIIDMITINTPFTNIDIEIINANGIRVSSHKIYGDAQIDLSSLPSGMYMLSAGIEDKNIKSEIFIKQ